MQKVFVAISAVVEASVVELAPPTSLLQHGVAPREWGKPPILLPSEDSIVGSDADLVRMRSQIAFKECAILRPASTFVQVMDALLHKLPDIRARSLMWQLVGNKTIQRTLQRLLLG